MKDKFMAIIFYIVSLLLLLALINFGYYYIFLGVLDFRDGLIGLIAMDIVLLLLAVYGIIMIKNIFKMIEIEKEHMIREINYKNLEEINKSLRIQRHDFLNNIQVIYGLLNINMPDEAIKYIQEMFKELKKFENIFRTKSIAVNALLNSKYSIAKIKNIDMRFDVKTALEYLDLMPHEITQILGNVIDNAIEAVETCGEKVVCIGIYEDDINYHFSVYNKGSFIPDDIIEHIFDYGFSTKGREGRGIGLYTAKSLLAARNGSIEAVNLDDGVEFRIHVEKHHPVQHNKMPKEGEGK
ncbi:sensor histidine kinase [Caldanaerobius polysaccharolyticus]|uniref:sensor histidine kinase n=1 Tax=Caldanaerobius polysaccharolyticus TaxID=44256 RepID=UPI00047C015E|nr:Spo0B domain-containing protein [Caldanaerobius polysaccharolyticus]